jgi:hypothetical protein
MGSGNGDYFFFFDIIITMVATIATTTNPQYIQNQQNLLNYTMGIKINHSVKINYTKHLYKP